MLALQSACGDLAKRLLDACMGRIGALPFVEDSEEIREKLLQSLSLVVSMRGGGEALGASLGTVVTLLTKAMQDNAPDNKRLCAQLCVRLCAQFSSEIHLYAKFVALIEHNLNHQRSKVRQASLIAIAEIVRCSAAFDTAAFSQLMDETVMPKMHTALGDRSAAVRAELMVQAAGWLPLFDQTNERLAASTFLLLASGAADENPTVQESSRKGLHSIAGSGGDETKPEGGNVAEMDADDDTEGMKDFARRHVAWLVPGLLTQCEDWTTDGRRRALQTLRIVLSLSGDSVLRYIQQLLKTLAVACVDEDEDVRSVAGQCAEQVGQNLSIDAVLPVLASLTSGSELKRIDAGILEVLAAVVRGTGSSCGTEVEELVEMLHAAAFGDADPEMDSLLRCVQEVLVALKSGHVTPSQEQCVKLLQILLLLSSQSEDEGMAAAAARSLPVLAEAGGFAHENDMLHKLLPSIVNTAVERCVKWDRFSRDWIVFDKLLRLAGPGIVDNVGIAGSVVNVILRTGRQEAPTELRLAVLSLLHALLVAVASGDSSLIAVHAQALALSMLLPNLSWRVGRVAGTVRKISTYCLDLIFERLASAPQKAGWVDENQASILPVVKSCLDDMETETRHFATHCMASLLRLLRPSAEVSGIYHDLVKRLDDANDAVRIVGCEALTNYCTCVKKEGLKGTPFTYILDACFIHLDDQNAEVRSAVQALVYTMVELNVDTATIIERAKKERLCHRTPQHCDNIIKAAQESASSSS